MKSIVFCSSQRFKKDLDEFMARLVALAREHNMHFEVLHPEFEEREESFYQLSEHERMKDEAYARNVLSVVYDHLFRKVKVADICFVFNKNGYLGPNTIGELFAAAALGKVVYALDEKCLTGKYPDMLHAEPCCRGLIHRVVASPEELVKYLV